MIWKVLILMLTFPQTSFKETWFILFCPWPHQDLGLNNMFTLRKNLEAKGRERQAGRQNRSFWGWALGGRKSGVRRKEGRGTRKDGWGCGWEVGVSGAQSLMGLAAPAWSFWEGCLKPVPYELGKRVEDLLMSSEGPSGWWRRTLYVINGGHNFSYQEHLSHSMSQEP